MRPLVAAALAICAIAPLGAQDGARQIWDSGFRAKRPSVSPSPETKTEKGSDYRTAAGSTPSTDTNARVIGLTVWRLRAPAARDTAPRLLIQEPGATRPSEFVAERVPSGQPLAVGDRVRLGIEVAHQGYLYVIDREQYRDGSRGAPHLIFPARNLRGGDNRVEPGRLIEIPSQSDSVPALRVTRTTARHVGEELTVIVTERPIAGVRPDGQEQRLPEETVAAWERQWESGAPAPRLDLASSAGASWSAVERDAGLTERLLTQDDPMPGSLYQVTPRGDGVLVRIALSVE